MKKIVLIFAAVAIAASSFALLPSKKEPAKLANDWYYVSCVPGVPIAQAGWCCAWVPTGTRCSKPNQCQCI